MSAAPKLRPTAPQQAAPVGKSAAAAASAARRARPREEADEASRGVHLSAVAAPLQARSLVPFASLCVAIIIAALAAVLFINIQMTEGAYERRDLKIDIAQLSEDREDLVTQLQQDAAPQRLADRAYDLGMVSPETLGYLSLDQGRVLEARTG